MADGFINYFPLLNNYIFALSAYDLQPKINNEHVLPFLNEPFEKYFEHSGIYIVSSDVYYSIVGGKKVSLLFTIEEQNLPISILWVHR